MSAWEQELRDAAIPGGECHLLGMYLAKNEALAITRRAVEAKHHERITSLVSTYREHLEDHPDERLEDVVTWFEDKPHQLMGRIKDFAITPLETERDELKAENERFREALDYIAQLPNPDFTPNDFMPSPEYWDDDNRDDIHGYQCGLREAATAADTALGTKP